MCLLRVSRKGRHIVIGFLVDRSIVIKEVTIQEKKIASERNALNRLCHYMTDEPSRRETQCVFPFEALLDFAAMRPSEMRVPS
jgi:hypothetical protein